MVNSCKANSSLTANCKTKYKYIFTNELAQYGGQSLLKKVNARFLYFRWVPNGS